MATDLKPTVSGAGPLARLLASVPRSAAQQRRTEIIIQRVRLGGWLLATALTVLPGGGEGDRSWAAVVALTASVLAAELVLRREPTPQRVRALGVTTFVLDSLAVASTLSATATDPADPIVLLPAILALEAAVRWQITGAVLGTAIGVPLSVAWRFAASEQAGGAAPAVEHLVFQSGLLLLVAVLIGSMVRRLERERHRTEEVLRHTPALIATLDPDGRLTSVNAAVGPLLGRDAHEVLGHRWEDLVATDTPPTSTARGEPCTYRRVVRPDGSRGWLEVTLRDTPTAAQRILVARDVTARVHADRRLAASEQRLRALFDHNLDAVFGFDIDGSLEVANPAAEVLFQRSRTELQRLHGLDLIEPSHRDAARIALGRALGGEAQHLEVVILHPDGTTAHADVDLIPIVVDREVVGVFGMGRDVTERKRREAYLEYRASHDLLTGLANRVSLREAARQHQLAGDVSGLLFIDLDGFKEINDTHGHAAGDQVLVAVARRLQAAVREQDLVCRLGGDEFCVLVAHSDPVQLQTIGDRVASSLLAPMTLDGVEVHIGASIGASLTRTDEDLSALLQRADAAMYTVKEHHRLHGDGDPDLTVLLAR